MHLKCTTTKTILARGRSALHNDLHITGLTTTYKLELPAIFLFPKKSPFLVSQKLYEIQQCTTYGGKTEEHPARPLFAANGPMTMSVGRIFNTAWEG